MLLDVSYPELVDAAREAWANMPVEDRRLLSDALAKWERRLDLPWPLRGSTAGAIAVGVAMGLAAVGKKVHKPDEHAMENLVLAVIARAEGWMVDA